MKTYFIIHPGLHSPVDFKPRHAVPLLGQADLWAQARAMPPSLLFRVRSERGQLGGPLSLEDRLESCIGLVDSVTRWRGVFRHAGYALNAIHNPQLADACGKALQVVASQHPSAVSVATRKQMADNIAHVCKTSMPTPFEQAVALSIANVVMADSDYEAASVVPFEHAFIPFSEREQPEEFKARLASIETQSGAMLITEAASRLAERLPQWIYATMPEPEPRSTRPIGPRSDAGPEEGDDSEAGADREEKGADDYDDKPDGL